MGKAVAGQHLPQLAYCLRIALKVRKWHAPILNMNGSQMPANPVGHLVRKLLKILALIMCWNLFIFFRQKLYFRGTFRLYYYRSRLIRRLLNRWIWTRKPYPPNNFLGRFSNHVPATVLLQT
jgi:hypothetical protein